MSSLRNAVKRITHKERSQPSSRQNLGLLEKKSDYRLRSQDYHKKSDRLKSMRTKAANRNPDEFYFGMHKSKVDGMSGNNTGRHVKTAAARSEEGLDFDTVRVMKDQDLAYIRMKRMMDAKKIERLQSSLHYLENDNGEDDNGLGRKKKKMTNRRKHTLFVEGGQEEVQQFDLAQHFETHPDLISRAFNRPRIMTLEGGAQKMDKKQGEDDDDEYDDEEGGSNSPHPHRPPPSAKQQLKAARQQRKFERSIAKARSGAYTEMEMRIERMNKLKAAEERLISEQHANAKGRKRKIVRDGDDDADGGGKRPAVYKWRRKRAR
jgi:U3 small nucleolar RNA-associated protein 11